MKIDKEKKIEEFNFQSEITKRLEERKTQQKDVEKEIQQAQQVIQQKVAESNRGSQEPRAHQWHDGDPGSNG